MGVLESAYRRKRLKKRRRRLLFSLASTGLLLGLLWQMPRAFPQYPWLEISPGFYQPELVSRTIETATPMLEPLPLQEEDSALRHKIETLLSAYTADLKPHLFYFNLQTRHYITIAGTDPVPAASVIKLPLLLTFFQHIDQGKITLYTHLLYQDFEQADGSGILQYQATEQPMPAQEVARMMIQSSDNTCTNMLLYRFGGVAEVNQIFHDWGLTRTAFQNWLPDLTGTNVISMQDMATILYNIDQGQALSPASRDAALRILEGTHNRRLLPALLPKEVKVAHKTGDIGISLGNAGLFTLPDGQKYIIAIQVERPFNDYRAKELIQQVSKIVYEEVKANPALARS